MNRVFSYLKRGTETRSEAPAHILVVDDERNIGMTVQVALEHVGHVVETATDGADGLRTFGDGRGWDLVLLDQRMPGMAGLDVLKEMRRREPECRVIMITAFGTVDLAVEAMKSGASDFLRKPFTTDMLRNAVQAALQRPTAGSPPVALPLTPDPGAVTFGVATLNGFRIESRPEAGVLPNGDTFHSFTVRNPSGESRVYGVHLPAYVAELVRAHADREDMPGADRFWQALCEEILANRIWQCGDFPEDATLVVDDLSPGLRRWIDAALGASVQGDTS